MSGAELWRWGPGLGARVTEELYFETDRPISLEPEPLPLEEKPVRGLREKGENSDKGL
jgi:hypothetical protein